MQYTRRRGGKYTGGTVFLSRRRDSLGICSLSNFNRALLGKWNLRFAEEENSVWRSVISLKYGAEDGGWFSNIPKGSHVVGLWKEISKEIGQLKLSSSFELGDGRKVILGGYLVW